MSTDRQLPPTVGTTEEYGASPFEQWAEWARVDDVVRITGEEGDRYLVTHPELVEEVVFGDGPFAKTEGIQQQFGRGLVAEHGEQWRAQRGVMQSAFAPDRIESYAETIGEVVADTVDTVDDGAALDLRELFAEFTMEVMVETLFGGSGDDEAIRTAVDRLNEWFLQQNTGGETPESVVSERDRAMRRLVGMIDEMIADRRGGDGDDFLSMLLSVGPDSDANYTDGRIREEVIAMLFAAHETTALTLTYTLYLLSGAPDVADRLHEETQSVLGGRRPGPDHLDELTYTERVIDEALRLYPPFHALPRQPTEAVALDGYTIPEGSVMYLSQYVIHRDERWWAEPTAFRPERFAGDDDRPRFAFFPFGAGPRRCLGEDFARTEAKLAVAGLTQQFSFEQLTETFELRIGGTALPDRPLELRAHDRE
jgi:cytochrome P450